MIIPILLIHIGSQVKTRWSQSYQFKQFAKISNFWKTFTRDTLWSCLIRSVNLKWIRRVLWKIQRGHDSVHRRTSWNQYTSLQLRWARGYNYSASVMELPQSCAEPLTYPATSLFLSSSNQQSTLSLVQNHSDNFLSIKLIKTSLKFYFKLNEIYLKFFFATDWCKLHPGPLLLTHWGRDKMAAISQTTF